LAADAAITVLRVDQVWMDRCCFDPL
jgi:hypothetical protein